ncbi:hypothetical protein HCU01_14210 [Halomonas cupida]|uniref:Transposase IS200 like n=1 Tax=Halomonas cupida TaxID=44933 RepID=A0ABQ0WD48_9GAMM|nr:hypothetical protein [Halomonas cupida]GEN23472.1 hypothetical protein HCU01_14210 [Halomonas cupida]
MTSLAALVLKLRVHLARFHVVFTPNSKHRALVVKTVWGKAREPEDA